MAERLSRPGGDIAYEVAGSGPLVVCIPGMGELRSSYRYTIPSLVEAGMRVVAMDLRGHGDSDTTFVRYDDIAAAEDVLALCGHLGGPAVLIGNSMGAGAAVIAAAQEPGSVVGVALIGPFVRNPPMNPVLVWLFKAMMSGPWAATMWTSYLPKLYPARKPHDFEHHRKAIARSLSGKARRKAFTATTRTSHEPAAAALPDVKCPVLVVMGERDPDFLDPEGEARWIAMQADAEILMVPNAGHYPQVEFPEIVNPALRHFGLGAHISA